MQTYHLHKFHHEEMSRFTSSKTIVPHTIKHNCPLYNHKYLMKWHMKILTKKLLLHKRNTMYAPLHSKLHSYFYAIWFGWNWKFLVEHNHWPVVDAHSSFQKLWKLENSRDQSGVMHNPSDNCKIKRNENPLYYNRERWEFGAWRKTHLKRGSSEHEKVEHEIQCHSRRSSYPSLLLPSQAS